MLTPQIIQLPDYSQFVGKEFVVTENAHMEKTPFNRPMLKGVRFIIKKIVNSQVTVKISNSKKELEELGMLEYDFNRAIKQNKHTVGVLKDVFKMWEDEPDKFVIDKSSVWNKDRSGDDLGHCVNTGYHGIPADHPHKYGMAKPRYDNTGKYYNSDSIMTMDYKRTDGKKNTYSYQSGSNEFYSKECYGFILKGEEINLKEWENKNYDCKKIVCGWILEKVKISIKVLNQMKFEPV